MHFRTALVRRGGGKMRAFPPPTPPAGNVSSNVAEGAPLAALTTSSALDVAYARLPGKTAPVDAGASWCAALERFHYHLATGNPISRDYAERVTRLYGEGAGSRASVIRWWWVMRGECLPYGTTEATTLVKRDLWKQALYNAKVLMHPKDWQRDEYARVTMQTAALALQHNQWKEALFVLERGLKNAHRCLPADSPAAVSSSSTTATTAELPPAELERIVVSHAVASVAHWYQCLHIAARFSRIALNDGTRATLERLSLHRAAMHPSGWRVALAYIDQKYVPTASTHRKRSAPRKALDAVLGGVAVRLACEKLHDSQRAAIYAEAMASRGHAITPAAERRALAALVAARKDPQILLSAITAARESVRAKTTDIVGPRDPISK
jgi:hypothetical protein